MEIAKELRESIQDKCSELIEAGFTVEQIVAVLKTLDRRIDVNQAQMGIRRFLRESKQRMDRLEKGGSNNG